MPEDESAGGVVKKIRSLRKKIQRREKSKRAKRRAKARRVRKNKPKTAGEAAKVKKKKAKQAASETASEAKQLSEDAKQLIATELGVSESESESIIKQGAKTLEKAGDSLDKLDVDGDGDTDLLTVLDQPTENKTSNQRGVGATDSIEAVPPRKQGPQKGAAEPVDPVKPVMDFKEDDDMYEPGEELFKQ